MANKTKCLTSGCTYKTSISNSSVSISVDFPYEIPLPKEEAKILETIMHNSIEICLRPYFFKEQKSKIKSGVKILFSKGKGVLKNKIYNIIS